MENNRKKVIIIGSGPSGILSIKHLKDICDVKCFEYRD
jgi:cation diffusion facilitator CzcD-associated flavoprotein CzcO